MLPAPAPGAAARAARVLQSLYEKKSGRSTLNPAASPGRKGRLSPAHTFAVRRYPISVALIEERLAQIYGADIGAADDVRDPKVAADDVRDPKVVDSQTDADALLPKHPPPGAPMVRSAVGPSGAFVQGGAAQERLVALADSAVLVSTPSGAVTFDISFRHEVLGPLACRITLKEGVIRAVFYAADVNTRRLLEAESGRLCRAIEDRGLVVSKVEVVVGEPVTAAWEG